ncbi:MAG: hypothetical protein Q3996_00985 [Candidatus Saccharibacteria bacterium]|nr:hypothetical protein [Candidatus Saccharibacteria bacterium]
MKKLKNWSLIFIEGEKDTKLIKELVSFINQPVSLRDTQKTFEIKKKMFLTGQSYGNGNKAMDGITIESSPILNLYKTYSKPDEIQVYSNTGYLYAIKKDTVSRNFKQEMANALK